ncbi:MAG: MBL fold metallo-hydrolase [Pseudorhodobacter sp.]
MAFFTEPEPERGKIHEVAEGVFRLVARNPSKMTYHGTNTYLMPDGDGYILLDPGPVTDDEHVKDILRATDGRIHTILISHGHADHFGALPELRKHTRADVYAFRLPMVATIEPDAVLDHGDQVGPLTALHTPGHAPDHLCFARKDGLVFTADHVMGWSSSVVSPPNGDMRAYIASLDLLIGRNDTLYLPGHGPAIPAPRHYVEELKLRRILRENEILDALQRGPASTDILRQTLYHKVDPVLQAAAERNVMAHLAKLQAEGKVSQDDELWFATTP